MKRGIYIILIVSLFGGCRQKDDNLKVINNRKDIYKSDPSNNDLAQQRIDNEKKFCSNDLDQEILANKTCLICHTDLGIDLVPTTRINLFKRGTTKLKMDIRRLKEIKDRQHAQILDTLTTDEIECIVDFIMKYKRVQP